MCKERGLGGFVIVYTVYTSYMVPPVLAYLRLILDLIRESEYSSQSRVRRGTREHFKWNSYRPMMFPEGHQSPDLECNAGKGVVP